MKVTITLDESQARAVEALRVKFGGRVWKNKEWPRWLAREALRAVIKAAADQDHLALPVTVDLRAATPEEMADDRPPNRLDPGQWLSE